MFVKWVNQGDKHGTEVLDVKRKCKENKYRNKWRKRKVLRTFETLEINPSSSDEETASEKITCGV